MTRLIRSFLHWLRFEDGRDDDMATDVRLITILQQGNRQFRIGELE